MGGENAWKEVKVFIFMFEDMVVKLCNKDGLKNVFLGSRERYGERVW